MMKFVSSLHKNICKRPFYFQWRNFSHVIYQLPLDPPQFDHAMASFLNFYANPCVYLLSLCKNVHSVKKIHGLLIVHGLTNDLSCSTKLVSLYGSFGYADIARLVFDRIPNPDFYSWKVMIRWYFLNDLYWDVIGFYNHMRICQREQDSVLFSIVLKACSELRDIHEGRKIHCQIVKVGDVDSFVSTGLVDMYAKCGEIDCSRVMFDESLDRNVVSWTSMIVGYIKNECAGEGLILFNKMRQELIDGNQYTLGSIVNACIKLGALHQGKWVHGYVIKSGIEFNSYLTTALLDMYVKFGVIRDARLVFDELSGTDLISWTAMVVGYTQNGCPHESLKLFMDKKWVDTLPNNVTLTSVVSACAQLGNLNLGKSIHGLGIKLGLMDTIVLNALIDMYAKCCVNGDARCVFETVLDKDVVAWNSIISGYSQNGSAYEALELFHQMRGESVLPDSVTVVSVFSACASLGALRVGSSLHACFIKKGLLSSNIYVGTSLLDFYAKCGDVNSAREVFDGMEDKNTITWSAMIGGYGIQGDTSGSLALFSDMLKKEVKPNEIIFSTILSACSHTGMVGDGWRLFASMCHDYNFVPSMKHYACMVDLLARAGKLEEALDFIKKMPVKPNVSVFGALLHGCGLHSRFDLGEVAIKRMLQLHPDEASYYVLICNLYASDGRWSQVKEVRELMKQRGLIKSPGCSLMEMDTGCDISLYRVASVT